MSIVIACLCTLLIVLIALNFSPNEKVIQHKISHFYGARDAQFKRSIANLLQSNFSSGNTVQLLKNGDEGFPAMLAAIAAAEHTICFETYVFWYGAVGEKFKEALIAKAQTGVKVHVILDWLGAKGRVSELVKELRSANIQIALYHPLSIFHLSNFNFRTHRKLLIVDGKIGFTGGLGIADSWSEKRSRKKEETAWRDNHYQLTGPVVASLQAIFHDNWLKTHADVLHGEHYFPEIEANGSIDAQAFQSSAAAGGESARLFYLLSISAAEESIRITTPYFVPDALTLHTLVQAAKRGVSIELIVPGSTIDYQIVQGASRSLWKPLLAAGVAIYEYQASMYHCKMLMVDSIWVSVGSINFDYRSFRLNDECNVNIINEDFCQKLIENFEEDKQNAKIVTLADWQQRTLACKLFDSFCGLFKTQL